VVDHIRVPYHRFTQTTALSEESLTKTMKWMAMRRNLNQTLALALL
jgi:hypothetical protein